MSNKTKEQKLADITQVTFPDESYPVLYKSYWSDSLDDDYKLENNKVGVLNLYMIDVYREYYNLLLDVDTISDITYVNNVTPYTLVYILRYKTIDGLERYLWEFFDNWMAIKELNITKWI